MGLFKKSKMVVFDPVRDKDRPALQKDLDGIIDLEHVNLTLEDPSIFDLPNARDYVLIGLTPNQITKINQECGLNYSMGSSIEYLPSLMCWRISEFAALDEDLMDMIGEYNTLQIKSGNSLWEYDIQRTTSEVSQELLKFENQLREYPWDEGQLEYFQNFNLAHFIDKLKEGGKSINQFNWFHLSRLLPLNTLNCLTEHSTLKRLIVFPQVLVREDINTLDGLLFLLRFRKNISYSLTAHMLFTKIYLNFEEFHPIFCEAIEKLYLFDESTKKVFKEDFYSLLSFYNSLSGTFPQQWLSESIVLEMLKEFPVLSSTIVEHHRVMEFSEDFFDKAEKLNPRFWDSASVAFVKLYKICLIDHEKLMGFVKRFELRFDFFSLFAEQVAFSRMELLNFQENFGEMHWDLLSRQSFLSFEAIQSFQEHLNMDKVWNKVLESGFYDEASKTLIVDIEARMAQLDSLIPFMLDNYHRLTDRFGFLEHFDENNVKEWANILFYEKEIDILPNVNIRKYITYNSPDDNFIDF